MRPATATHFGCRCSPTTEQVRSPAIQHGLIQRGWQLRCGQSVRPYGSSFWPARLATDGSWSLMGSWTSSAYRDGRRSFVALKCFTAFCVPLPRRTSTGRSGWKRHLRRTARPPANTRVLLFAHPYIRGPIRRPSCTTSRPYWNTQGVRSPCTSFPRLRSARSTAKQWRNSPSTKG